MSTPLRRYYRGHNLVAMRDEQAGATSYYHFDHQGTTQCLTNSAGTVTDRFASDAWGVQVKRTGSSINRQWYIGNFGYYRQKDQMLDYVRARYLDVMRGRWRGLDPAGFGPDPWGRYRYVWAAPIRHIDPSGMACRITDPLPIKVSFPAGGCASIVQGRHYTQPDDFTAWTICLRLPVVLTAHVTCDLGSSLMTPRWISCKQEITVQGPIPNIFINEQTYTDDSPLLGRACSFNPNPNARWPVAYRMVDAPGLALGTLTANCKAATFASTPGPYNTLDSGQPFSYTRARFKSKWTAGWQQRDATWKVIAKGTLDTGWSYWHICYGLTADNVPGGPLAAHTQGWNDAGENQTTWKTCAA